MTNSQATVQKLISTKEMVYLVASVHEVLLAFNGDRSKTAMWMNTRNPMFGGIIPFNMIMVGRGEKLLKLIKNLKDGNFE